MKKILTFIAILFLGTSTTFAQTSGKSSAPKQTAKNAVTIKNGTKTVAVKPTAPILAKKEVKKTTATVSSTKLKADGTPDMRYAENKGKKGVIAGPTKKDGTADMRYKANKPAKKN